MSERTSKEPYLIRALYEWLVDNGLTPYILVNLDYPGVVVPAHLGRKPQPGEDSPTLLVLNIAMKAVSNLSMSGDTIYFSARFSQVSHNLTIPMKAVMKIFANEDGEGMTFADALRYRRPLMDAPAAISSATPSDQQVYDGIAKDYHNNATPSDDGKGKKRSHLSVVK